MNVSSFSANVVRLLHILLILFIVVVPFVKRVHWTFLLLHTSASILLLLHWFAHEDTCALTYLESYLRGVPVKQSFMYDLVSPVYKIEDEQLKKIVSICTIILGLISASRLYSNWHNVKNDLSIAFGNMFGITKVNYDANSYV